MAEDLSGRYKTVIETLTEYLPLIAVELKTLQLDTEPPIATTFPTVFAQPDDLVLRPADEPEKNEGFVTNRAWHEHARDWRKQATRPACPIDQLGLSQQHHKMRIVFSRKGFDSGAGGFPSPIIDGRPISLPIPTPRRSATSYGDLGLGDIVEQVTSGRLTRGSLCHYDPMFEAGRCVLGQTGAAQAHLRNNGVTAGDVFLFFGLFAEADGRDRHHRIFGYLEVQSVHALGAEPDTNDQPSGFSNRHPHTIGEWNRNNTIYVGRGRLSVTTPPDLRLSIPGEQISRWRVPAWLRAAGLTYHGRPDRWTGNGTLSVVGRGQEFVSDISNTPEAGAWLDRVKAAINEGTCNHG